MKSQEVAVKPVVNVVLHSDTEVLDEVMVVAYGTTKKSSFTGSAATMKAGEISTQKQSLVKSLDGKVAGVRVGGSTGDPGADQKILIRGIGSINGSTQPLYVIDGVPVVNDDMSSGLKSQSILSSINPDDIESMTILKDAAAASLYGSRAANGVVIITTKKGKEGKTKVTYNMETGWTKMAVESQYNTMNASQIQQYYNDAFKNFAEIMPAAANEYSEYYLNKPLTDATSFANEFTPMFFWNPGSDIDTNWKDQVYRTGMITDHQVGISGGTDKTKFYAGFGYNKTNGIVSGSDFERYSGRINVDHQAYKWLNLSFRQMLSFTGTNGFRDQNDQAQGFGTSSPLSILYSMDPTAENILEDGSYNENASFSSKISNPNLMLGQTTGPNAETVSSDMLRSLTNFEATINLPLGFTARTLFGYDYMDNKEREFWAPESVNGESYGGLGARYVYTNKTLTSSTTLGYNNTFGSHNLNALIGYEIEDRYLLMQYLSAKTYPTNKLPELSNGQPHQMASEYYESSIMSYLGNVNYNYDMKYLFSASLRYDGSSHFAANHKFAAFPGVSAGWNIHRENFFEPIRDIVNNLKLRLSWGKTGNDNLALENTEGSYEAGKNYAGEAGILNTVLMNRDLLWEETTSANLGFDVGLLNNRINLLVDMYQKETTNRLLNENLWSETGFSSIKSNFGSLITKGIEFSIDATPIQTKDFRWDIGFNFTFWRTTIGKLPENGADKNRTGGGIIFDPELGKYVEVGGFAEGERFGTRFAYQFDGVYSTDAEAADAPYDEGVSSVWLGKGKCAGDAIWRDVDGNGIINSKDMVFVGYLHPDKLGAFNNTFRYKKFTLKFMTDFSMGNVIDNQFRSQANANSRHNYATIHDVASSEMWHKPGDIASIPRYDVESDWDNGKRNHGRPNSSTIGFSGGSVNTLYIKKGDYWAFRELSLSYALQTKWLKAAKIETLDITAAMYNLGYLTAYDGLTPEVIGADAGKYSRPRQFLFSVKFTL